MNKAQSTSEYGVCQSKKGILDFPFGYAKRAYFKEVQFPSGTSKRRRFSPVTATDARRLSSQLICHVIMSRDFIEWYESILILRSRNHNLTPKKLRTQNRISFEVALDGKES